MHPPFVHFVVATVVRSESGLRISGRLKPKIFTIIEDGKVVGIIRVKPSAIMWKGPHARESYRISPEKLGEFAKDNGKKMKM